MRNETKCLHAGYTPRNTEPRVMPIVQSTTYVYESTEEVAAVLLFLMQAHYWPTGGFYRFYYIR